MANIRRLDDIKDEISHKFAIDDAENSNLQRSKIQWYDKFFKITYRQSSCFSQ